MTKLNDLKAKMERVRQEMSASGKEALLEAFRDFFEKNPGIVALKWQQYTPYFNDGDTCEFDVYPFSFKPREGLKIPKNAYADEDEFVDSQHKIKGHVEGVGLCGANLKGEVDTLYEEVVVTDLFHLVFGDHVECVATPEGIDVHQYEHD
jgi:hypothetical protein